MTQRRQEIGKTGEEQATEFLRQKGWEIIATNYKVPIGEIDILAEDGATLVIVEVKTKTGREYGLPQEKVNYWKQTKLRNLARYLSQEYPKRDLRIDVVGIEELDGQTQINYIKNAVEGTIR